MGFVCGVNLPVLAIPTIPFPKLLPPELFPQALHNMPCNLIRPNLIHRDHLKPKELILSHIGVSSEQLPSGLKKEPIIPSLPNFGCIFHQRRVHLDMQHRRLICQGDVHSARLGHTGHYADELVAGVVVLLLPV